MEIKLDPMFVSQRKQAIAWCTAQLVAPKEWRYAQDPWDPIIAQLQLSASQWQLVAQQQQKEWIAHFPQLVKPLE